MQEKPEYLHYLHSFRGFAILCIVAVHAGVMPLVALNNFQEADESNWMYILNEVIFHDSTIYFALISGLLFSAILSRRGWKRFYRNKFLYIFLPYLFFSVLLSIVKPPTEQGEAPGLHPDVLSYLMALGKNLLYGMAMPIYWYLPVLFILYFLTPLISKILQFNGALKFLIFPIVLAPLLISRQPLAFDYNFYWQNPVYFLGAYACGMWVGYHLNDFLEWIESRKIFLVMLVLITFGGLGYLHRSDINVVGFVSLRESFHYINKLTIAALVILYFKNLSSQPKVITVLADDAFAIYFIHFGFIFLAMSPFIPFIQNQSFYPFNVIVSILLVLVLTLLLTKGLIFLLKKLLRKYSRMVIGS